MAETPVHTLDRMGIRHNTDKASLGRQKPASHGTVERGPGHDYLTKYEFFLEKYRSRADVTLMELGAGPDWNLGASANLWKEYFHRDDFRLHVVDIKKSSLALADDRTRVWVGDLGERNFLVELSKLSPDIIIDDASHLWDHQLLALFSLFPSVKTAGLYIIEDVHTSFDETGGRWSNGSAIDAYSVVSSLIALVAGRGRPHRLCDPTLPFYDETVRLSRHIDGITVINESVIIAKNEYFS